MKVRQISVDLTDKHRIVVDTGLYDANAPMAVFRCGEKTIVLSYGSNDKNPTSELIYTTLSNLSELKPIGKLVQVAARGMLCQSSECGDRLIVGDLVFQPYLSKQGNIFYALPSGKFAF